MSIALIGGLIIGLFPGFGVGFLYKLIKGKKELKNLKHDLSEAKRLQELAIKQRDVYAQKLVDVRSMLADALATIEVLQAYKEIDDKTKEEIKEIKDSLVNGEPSDDTYERYKKLIDEINKRNQK